MLIAIDGPAGAGKSSVARAVAAALGVRWLDTGAMYRAVALLVANAGADPRDERACASIARDARLDFDARGELSIDGDLAGQALRSRAVGSIVSLVAEHPAVRASMVAKQREFAAAWRGLVAEGRDMTSVVFPHADFKFYLGASSAERARRRAAQEQVLGDPVRVEEIRREIETRDAIDSSRACSPLVRVPDAFYVDTDVLSERAVIDTVLGRIRKAKRD
ncbi:MAG: (d)CMP kinase [Planctomycetota bacterium]|nr:MAG: (d)CMP kinase [Planctomycetota bacterium]